MDALRELLFHPDPDLQRQGVELCRALGRPAIREVLSSTLTCEQGWLLSPRPWSTALLNLLLDTEPGDLPAGATRLCLAGLQGLNPLLPKLTARFPGLTELDLSFTGTTHLTALSSLTRLQALHLQGCDTALLDLHLLHALPQLRTLDLSDTRSTAAVTLPPLHTLKLDRVWLPPECPLPPTLQHLSADGATIVTDMLSGLSLTTLSAIGAEGLENQALDTARLTSLRLSFSPQLDPRRLPATALQIRNSTTTRLAAIQRAFRRLEDAQLVQVSGCPPFVGISELPPLILDTTRVETPPARGWPRGCVPAPAMYALRRRRGAVSVPRAAHDAGAVRWRAAGRSWALRAPKMRASDRIPFIKMIRTLTRWPLLLSKTSTDPLYDQTAECYTLHEALRTQGLWARCGQQTTLTPWT